MVENKGGFPGVIFHPTFFRSYFSESSTWRMRSQWPWIRWVITVVIVGKSPKDWVVGSLPNRHSCLANGVTNYLLTGMSHTTPRRKTEQGHNEQNLNGQFYHVAIVPHSLTCCSCDLCVWTIWYSSKRTHLEQWSTHLWHFIILVS